MRSSKYLELYSDKPSEIMQQSYFFVLDNGKRGAQFVKFIIIDSGKFFSQYQMPISHAHTNKQILTPCRIIKNVSDSYVGKVQNVAVTLDSGVTVRFLKSLNFTIHSPQESLKFGDIKSCQVLIVVNNSYPRCFVNCEPACNIVILITGDIRRISLKHESFPI